MKMGKIKIEMYSFENKLVKKQTYNLNFQECNEHMELHIIKKKQI